MFLDQVVIEVQGGAGGNGCVSFRRERFVPRGGPDGGDGGDGGSVIVRAAVDVDSLMPLSHRKFWKAERGGHGQGALRHGKNGADLTILVPPGTLVRDPSHGLVIKDLVHEGDGVIVARGGRGGRGNASFKSSTHRAPREFTRGAPGEQKRIELELKIIADVGLIGKPNAGKSTLLSRLSRARPEIADYPFTTKYPNLGRVPIDADRSFVLADIPGLIEGAHRGVGLGHEFLRHIQRAGILVHLVEPMPVDGSDPLQNYRSIRHELTCYDPELARRPEIVVVSKAELPRAEEVRDQLAREVPDTESGPVLSISSVTGLGLRELVSTIARYLSEARR